MYSRIITLRVYIICLVLWPYLQADCSEYMLPPADVLEKMEVIRNGVYKVGLSLNGLKRFLPLAQSLAIQDIYEQESLPVGSESRTGWLEEQKLLKDGQEELSPDDVNAVMKLRDEIIKKYRELAEKAKKQDISILLSMSSRP